MPANISTPTDEDSGDGFRDELRALFDRNAPPDIPVNLASLTSRANRRHRWLRRLPARVWPTAGLAACLLIGAAVWLVSTTPPARAFAEVQARVERARTVQYTETRTFPAGIKVPRIVRKYYVLGRYLQRVEEVEPVDLKGLISINDFEHGTFISIDPEHKTVTAYKEQELIDFLGKSTTSQLKPNLKADFYDQMRRLPAGQVQSLPRRTIDGQQVVGFRKVASHGRSGTWTRTVWVDAATNLPVRIEVSQRTTDKSIVGSDWVMSDFVFDQPLDPALFDTKPPEGYLIKHDKILGIEIE